MPPRKERARIKLLILQCQLNVCKVNTWKAFCNNGLFSKRAGFLIFTCYSDDYSLGRMCSAVNQRYAAQHGYHFEQEVLSFKEMLATIQPRTHCTWYKVHKLNRLLADQDRLLRDNIRYIVWIDADAVVVNNSVTLEEVVDRAEGRDLILAEDMHPGCLVNAGVLLVRVGQWSRSLWRDVWESEQSKRFHDVFFYEQSALLAHLKSRNEGLGAVNPFHSYAGGPKLKLFPHVAALPMQSLNTNIDAFIDADGKTNTTDPGKNSNSKGDLVHAEFIFHAAGNIRGGKLQALTAVLRGHGVNLTGIEVSEFHLNRHDSNKK
eukprot:CAMPEP_0175120356 /NCGR_PEP_ID=MMETSP0087-20121206/578_1 /TAXON_ID=136419 /ORGANISM="Unknown Unknown, Strain D1" /LENGTH=318 /DNA_ID=CAMNT_0016401799 /DNA_START=117 /DNA_END=1070 /DNA_ORIENTATION=-